MFSSVVLANAVIPRRRPRESLFRRPRECGDPGLTVLQFSMVVDHGTLDSRIRGNDEGFLNYY